MTNLALIPAYEPDKKLISLTEELAARGYTIIVVDDGSGSDYGKIFEQIKKNVALLIHEKNKGKGAALKTGLSYIRNTYNAPYTIVTADADGQHNVEDIERVTMAVSNDKNTLILGSRRLNKNVPLRSRFGNTLTRNIFRLSTGNKIYDTQTGLRAFTDRLLPDLLTINGERYEYEMNMLMELSRRKIPIKEIEIETIYIDDNSSSHFNALRDSYRIYKEIIKFSASSLISFFVDYLLYCLFCHYTGITCANISARLISSSVNYSINKKYVFRNTQSVRYSLPKYFMLAIFILTFNTLLLNLFVHIRISKYVAKLMAEVIMFLVSYTAQHFFVFKNAHKKSED